MGINKICKENYLLEYMETISRWCLETRIMGVISLYVVYIFVRLGFIYSELINVSLEENA